MDETKFTISDDLRKWLNFYLGSASIKFLMDSSAEIYFYAFIIDSHIN